MPTDTMKLLVIAEKHDPSLTTRIMETMDRLGGCLKGGHKSSLTKEKEDGNNESKT